NEIRATAKGDAPTAAAKIKAADEPENANLTCKARAIPRQQVATLAVAGAERILQREIDATRHRDLLEALAKEI
ncbi:MAG: F0F1 ATP synthase subunit B, partial [Pseudomonadota bacterium]